MHAICIHHFSYQAVTRISLLCNAQSQLAEPATTSALDRTASAWDVPFAYPPERRQGSMLGHFAVIAVLLFDERLVEPLQVEPVNNVPLVAVARPQTK